MTTRIGTPSSVSCVGWGGVKDAGKSIGQVWFGEVWERRVAFGNRIVGSGTSLVDLPMGQGFTRGLVRYRVGRCETVVGQSSGAVGSLSVGCWQSGGVGGKLGLVCILDLTGSRRF